MKIECKRGFSTLISKGAHEIQSERGFSTPISKEAHGPTARHSSQPVLLVTLLSTFGVRVKPEGK